MVKFTKKLQKAIDTASKLHHGQMRKCEARLPYVSHLFSVAMILAEYTDDETIIIAGLLHDTLEDVPGYTYEMLKADFGKKVADIVRGVSEVEGVAEMKSLPWLQRKELYLKKLSTDKEAALLVSAADKIHNLLSFAEEYQKNGECVRRSFHSSKKDQWWFYQEILRIIKSRIKHPLVGRLEKVLKQSKKLFT